MDSPKPRVKVALLGLSAFTSDIIDVILRESQEINVVAHLEQSADLWTDFERSGADVMICSRSEVDMEELWSASLQRRPPIVVLNLIDDHKWGRLYALYPKRQNVADLSAASLVEILRVHAPR